MEAKFLELKNRLAEYWDLIKVSSLLEWDQRTQMPANGSAVRAEQLATVGRMAHEKFIDPAVGQLIDQLQPWAEGRPYESDAAALIRWARREYDKARRVPSALKAEMTRAASLGEDAWVQARRQSDFSIFLPFLARNVDLKFKYVECFDEAEHIYDVLLDDYEPGMKTAQVRKVFDDLKQGLLPLIAAIGQRAERVSDACLHGHFPAEAQRAFALSIVERFGFTPQGWRLDPTVHPFATSLGPGDIRITTRYHEDYIGAGLFGTLHECGHGLYENGVDPALERTPLCRGTSLGIHESQSRMWENLVGRSRPFWKFFFPQLQAAFPQQFKSVDAETFYRAINKAQPSLIRVEADEATYNLHIILRFELEQEMMEGKMALKDLPEVWNTRMKEYLGIDVPNDAQGVLQDVHWSGGGIGYFPTYSLGNIISCQVWEQARTALPDLDRQFERGEFMALREWLRDNIHRHGRKYTPGEILQRVAGGPIKVGPYVKYLQAKFGEIYGLS